MKEFVEHLIKETENEIICMKNSFEDDLLNEGFSKRNIKRMRERKSKGKKKYGFK